MWEISWNTGYILSNVYVGVREIVGAGYWVNDVQMMKTDKLQLMMS